MAQKLSSPGKRLVLDLVSPLGFVEGSLGLDFGFIYLPFLGTTGVSAAALAPGLNLPRNTLVQRFDVVVGATRATRTPAQAAGQVRAYNNNGMHTVIIDFGVPRTVSSVSAAFGSSVEILKVAAWIGAKFDAPFFGPVVGPAQPKTAARFSAEVRAERLLVTLNAAASPAIGTDLELELPELPTDLSLSINGGAPVWTHPGAAQPNTDTGLSFNAFNRDGQRLVSLADALNALLASPLASDIVKLDIVLAAKVPGVLTIAEATSANARDLRLIKRMAYAGDNTSTLAFAAEGRLPLALDLPPPAAGLRRQIKSVKLTALATPGPERVLPPEGPAPALLANGQVLAELLLDPDRAAIVRLQAEPKLAALTGLRLPLLSGGDGAEVRVVLWSSTPGSAAEPLQTLPGGASEPVSLSAPGGAATGDNWTTFSFAKPVPLDPANPPWAAVLVARGSLTWALARRADAPSCELRRGGPTGPWRALPAALSGPVLDACGRVRRIGTAPKDHPLPAWELALDGDGASAAVPATAKGAAVSLTPASGNGSALSVLAFGAGSLTLRDIDVIWAESP